MDEHQLLDAIVASLTDCFPDVDSEILLESALQSNCKLVDAIDHVMVRLNFMDNGDEERSGEVVEENKSYSELVLQLSRHFPQIELDLIEAFVESHCDIQDPSKLKSILSSLISGNITTAVKSSSRRVKRVPIECHFGVKRTGDSGRTLPLYEHLLKFMESHINDDRFDPTSRQDPNDLRELSIKLHRKRGEIFTQASSYYRQSGITGKATSQYYSLDAANITAQIESLNWKIAFWSFVIRNELLEDQLIDLHGLTVTIALAILDEIIEYRIVKGQKNVLYIVTGAGKHSQGGPRLLPAIWKKLSMEKIKFLYDGNATFELR